MKKILVIIILCFYSIAYSQQIKPIKATSELDDIIKDNKGNVILFNLWATWCKPCVEEFPDLIKLYNNYKDRNFTIIFISIDFKEEINTKLIPFLKENDVNFVTYFDDFKNQDELINYFDKKWDGGIPSTYIFDKNGVEESKFLGIKDYSFYEREIQKFID
jgi:thiol-disulfide isomerase/thioredoxin